MSTTNTDRGRVPRRAVLPPAILEIFKEDEPGRRQVVARITRRNKCVDCDFLGAAPRDLRAHYSKRASHGFVANGPREQCFLCGEQFCMRQTLDGHHKVMHTAKGPFAKLRSNGITLPGETAAQAQTHSMATAATPLPAASVRSGQSGPPAFVASPSLGADPFDSAIDQERDHQTEQLEFGERTQRNDRTNVHTPNQSTSHSIEAAGMALLHQFMAAEEVDHQSSPPRGGDVPTEYQRPDTNSTYPSSGVEQRGETAVTRRSGDHGDQLMGEVALLDAFDAENGNWDVDMAEGLPDLTGGPTPAESSEATTPHSMDDTSPEFGSQADNGYKQGLCTPACVGNYHAESCFLWLPDF
ncbi:hypothetical protein M409DRAFT_18911 [Zasmidium cellare ATCC 36951]|uniref:C2H2-type domain-containing protein n=1 Tax=Zasmidium cellare ATCC 36951 TaxID=1080233 RepID=A0A6A6CXK0_ZASCE|nr:uncharacterized protein M409DRAFT_18911 [Zasmidium cellare ATCC 36951]KAF2170940.1 hypothetical protein M409DRAFT_18911 [Zasmidium cellare ATCC 36951]